MIEFFGSKRLIETSYEKLFSHLTRGWLMRKRYAVAFLTAYKKPIFHLRKQFLNGFAEMAKSDDPAVHLKSVELAGTENDWALVAQAHWGYLQDLRRGKHVGTEVEIAIWAILSNRIDLLEEIDRGLAKYITDKRQEKFPNLLYTVFEIDESEASSSSAPLPPDVERIFAKVRHF